jgi:hypothetical protein
MPGQQFDRPQAITQVLGHQHLAEQLQAEEGDAAGLLLAVGPFKRR